MEKIVAAIETLTEVIEAKDQDEYHSTNSATHLFNIAYSLDEIANTLKKIEAKMK